MNLVRIFSRLFTCIFLLYSPQVIAQNQYPNVYNIYSKKQLDSIVTKYSQKHDTLGLAYAFWTYAQNIEKSNQLSDSILVYFRKSMESFETVKDSNNYFEIRGRLGYYYMYRPFLEQYAIEHLANSVAYFRSKKNYYSEIGPLINLTNIYIYANNYQVAETMLKRGEWLNNIIHNKFNEGQLNAAAADLYSRQKQYQKASGYAKKALNIAKKMKIDWLEPVSLYYLARCYEGLKQYDKMLPNLLLSEKLTENSKPLLQLRKEIYDNLRNYYYMKKNYAKSYEYAMKLINTQNIIYFDRKAGDIHLSAEYRFLDEQAKAISKHSLERKLASAEIERLRSKHQLYRVTFAFIFLVLSFMAYSFWNRLRIGKLRAAQIDKNYQIETRNALIHGQELERIRIGQELHDGLGTMLSRMKILISSNIEKDKILNMVDEAYAEVRTISDNLQPNALSNLGLIPSIQALISKQNSTSPTIIFQQYGEIVQVDENNSLMIYRIIQELLTNALKHAQANEILIQIAFLEKKQLSITVEDNGIGFNELNAQIDGHGWKNIRSRVNYLNGVINVHVFKGTSISIFIPLT